MGSPIKPPLDLVDPICCVVWQALELRPGLRNNETIIFFYKNGNILITIDILKNIFVVSFFVKLSANYSWQIYIIINVLVERINTKIIRFIKIFCAEQETMDWDLF